MKTKQEIINKRREAIITKLKENQSVDVHELAKIFNTTEITIRRDLQFLEDQKIAIRYYGGAKLNPDFLSENHNDEINSIAKMAAQQIVDNDTIFINSSSTALALIPYITANNVKIFTNNVNVLDIDIPQQVSIFITGGELKSPKNALVGDFALNNLLSVVADKAFIGCNGLDSGGIYTIDPQEVIINRTMLKHSQENYILLDHEKINKRFNFCITGLDYINCLITDYNYDPKTIENLKIKRIITTNKALTY